MAETKNLDFSDIPELTDEELKKGRRVGRPSTGKAKHLVAVGVTPLFSKCQADSEIEGSNVPTMNFA